ncbi:MAG: TSUP family transporter [Thaumarchaeota archaeon]|nr:TSUP family transporter [Nitrososphaerota archaeon]
MVEPLLPLILLLIGLLVGFFSSLLGLGGGVILVPILILGFGLTTQRCEHKLSSCFSNRCLSDLGIC